MVASLSGLPGKDLPVYQQTGGAILGYTVTASMMWRAANWEQVRISLIGALTFVTLSAFYNVALMSVAKPYLILILLFLVLFEIDFGHYLWRFEKLHES